MEETMHTNQQVCWNLSGILQPDSLSQSAFKEYLEAIQPFDRDLLRRQSLRQSEAYPDLQKEFVPLLEEDLELHDLFRDPEICIQQDMPGDSDIPDEDSFSIEADRIRVYEEPLEAFG